MGPALEACDQLLWQEKGPDMEGLSMSPLSPPSFCLRWEVWDCRAGTAPDLRRPGWECLMFPVC